MLIIKSQSAKLKINKERIESYKQKSKSLPIVTCSCGTKILVVPDLAAMNRAVKNHLFKHKSANEPFIAQQILMVATKQVLH
jgi:hypothetical protein